MARRNDDFEEDEGTTTQPTPAGGSQGRITEAQMNNTGSALRPDQVQVAPRQPSPYDLPGFNDRTAKLNALADQYGGRGAPQSADSSFRGYQAGLAQQLDEQLRSGKSLAALQYRANADNAMAQQRAMAASASPQNQAMAQRAAMQNAGNIAQGMGSQAAMLQMQERAQLQNQLAGLANQGRGQDLSNNQFNVSAQLQQTGMNDQASLQARDLELRNAALQQQGQMARDQQPEDASWWEQGLGIAASAAPLIALASDERAKKNVSSPSGNKLDELISSLSAKDFEYKEPDRFGEGRRMGVMAQDVEKGGGGGLVMGLPDGTKALDVPKSLGAALGLIGRLGDRVGELEGKGKGPRLMAAGGVATQPTDAIVGEAGPEAIIPLGPYSNTAEQAEAVGKQAAAVAPGLGRNAAINSAFARQQRGPAKNMEGIGFAEDKRREAEEAADRKSNLALAEGVAGMGREMLNKGKKPGAGGKIAEALAAFTPMIAGKVEKGIEKEKLQDKLFDIAGKTGAPTSSGISAALAAPRGFLGGYAAPPVFMAQGGIVTRPTDAVVGERGPEAIIPMGGPVAARTKQTARGMVGGAPPPPPPPPPPQQQAQSMAPRPPARPPGPFGGFPPGLGAGAGLGGRPVPSGLGAAMAGAASQGPAPPPPGGWGAAMGGMAGAALGGGRPVPQLGAGAALGGQALPSPGLGGRLGGINPAVMMAKGGIVTEPTRTILGEAGPEAVIPLHKLPEVVRRLKGERSRTAVARNDEELNRLGTDPEPAPEPTLPRRDELQRERLTEEERAKKRQEYREREGYQRERKEKRSKEEMEKDRRKATRAEALKGLSRGSY